MDYIPIALFTVTFSHLQYNIFERECEAISGKKCKTARNCLASTFKDIVMQMRKGNREKGITYQSLHGRGVLQLWNFSKKGRGHGTQSFLRPRREPVDGTTVNKGRKLTETSSEYLTDWAVEKKVSGQLSTELRTSKQGSRENRRRTQ